MSEASVQPMSAEDAYGWRVGRWSQLVGRSFVAWLGLPRGLRWLEIGCGMGALSQAILETSGASRLAGIDPCGDNIAWARKKLLDTRAEYHQASAEALPFSSGAFDVIASGLVLDSLSEARLAMREMLRVAVPGGTVAGYVWDFAGEMQVLRRFWDEAIAVDPAAAEVDHGTRYPLCRPEPLRQLFVEAGLLDVEVRPMDVAAHFPDFNTYWTALTTGDVATKDYVDSISGERRETVCSGLYQSLPWRADGSFALLARAWAIRARTPQ